MPIEDEISESQIKKINLLDKFREITRREYDPHEEVRTVKSSRGVNLRPGKGPWKKNVAAPSTSTPWAIDLTVKPGFKHDPTRPDFGLGAEWLAWTEGSRPVRGHKTSLKKMGLKGQPKPELAMTEDRVENRLRGQVYYNIHSSEGKQFPSFDEFLEYQGHATLDRDNWGVAESRRKKLIDLYGEKEGRKFWKVDVEAEREVWIKKQKEIWEYAKEFEKSTATKDKKKSNEYLPPMVIPMK